VPNGARERSAVLRRLTEPRRKLAVAEDSLGAQAAMKRAETAFDAASDRSDASERAP
jgi:hypothetical protein